MVSIGNATPQTNPGAQVSHSIPHLHGWSRLISSIGVIERDHSTRHEGACGPIDVQIVVDRRRLTNYPKDIVFTVKTKPATIYVLIAQESLALVLPAFPTYITLPTER